MPEHTAVTIAFCSERMEKLEEKYEKLLEVTSTMYQRVDDIHHELLGNGNPGRIQRLETEQRYFEQELKKVQSYIAHHKGRSSVIAVVVSSVITALVTAGDHLIAAAHQFFR